MDYSIILGKYYLNYSWSCGDTYQTLEWYDDAIPKPTEEELNVKWEELLLDNMREHRNRLLQESDYRALPDFPNNNKEAWLSYREALRNLPETWSVSNPAFPTPPI